MARSWLSTPTARSKCSSWCCLPSRGSPQFECQLSSRSLQYDGHAGRVMDEVYESMISSGDKTVGSAIKSTVSFF